MNKHLITIIDDGINQNFFEVGELKHNLHITSELDICERVGYDPFLPSHGTTCAAIIKKYAPDAILSSIKILGDESLKGMKEQLVKALEWCSNNKVRLVNLSLGTIDFKDFPVIEKLVNYAADRGVIVVAACNNRNIYTCPASLKKVIGVKCDHSGILEEQKYMYNTDALDGIEITACGSHELVNYKGESKITPACNSFATPAVTALVYNMIKEDERITIDQIKENLKEKAVKYPICEDNFFKREIYRGRYDSENIEIPILVLYNFAKNSESLNNVDIYEIAIQLTELFRKEGYNTISAVSNQFYANCIKGIVPISEVNIEKYGLAKELKCICTVFDPDFLIVPIDTEKEELKMDIESHYEIDIKINVFDDVLEVTSEKGSKKFDIQKGIDIKMLYIYIYVLLG